MTEGGVPLISNAEWSFAIYKHQFVRQYGDLGAAMVKDVEEGRKTAEEFFATVNRAHTPCPECGRPR